MVRRNKQSGDISVKSPVRTPDERDTLMVQGGVIAVLRCEILRDFGEIPNGVIMKSVISLTPKS